MSCGSSTVEFVRHKVRLHNDEGSSENGTEAKRVGSLEVPKYLKCRISLAVLELLLPTSAVGQVQ